MRVERRKFERYCIKESVFAVFKPEPVKLVPIVDISLGGLGVSVNGISGSEHGLHSCSFLEIMVADCSFYLDNLPYEPLSQCRNLHWDATGSLQNQFYGLKFLNLMPSQKTHLKHFIRKHTIGGMTPQFIRKFNQFFHQALGKKQFKDSCQNIWLHRPTF
jgi:c-di-GMP-binding flagellar brake protein YcgR